MADARADCPPSSSIACESAFMNALSTRVYFMSTGGVSVDQHPLYGMPMNLGKRIAWRLDDLGKRRGFLLDAVPDLSPQRLSALISRDSKRCELDVQIAKALGVRLEWLNNGELPMEATDIVESSSDMRSTVALKPLSKRDVRIASIIELMHKTDMEGLVLILDKAKEAAKEYPLVKQTRESSL